MSTYETGATNGPSSTAEQAKDKAQEAAGQAMGKAQESAQQAAGQARSQLRQQVDQRSTQAGERVTSTADDVRSVAQQLREQGKEQPAKVAERAADQAQKVGDYLTRSDGDSILDDLENIGRRQPWAVMFGGLTLGFLASRFLKASSSRRYESRYETSGRLPARRGDLAGAGIRPPATSYGNVGAPVTREPGLSSPTPGRPAEDVSLSGGVIPADAPGATRPGGAL